MVTDTLTLLLSNSDHLKECAGFVPFANSCGIDSDIPQNVIVEIAQNPLRSVLPALGCITVGRDLET